VKAAVVYADESGTHGKKSLEKGSLFPTIAGFAAPVGEWDRFRKGEKLKKECFGA